MCNYLPKRFPKHLKCILYKRNNFLSKLPLITLCYMFMTSGGWLLVLNVVINSSATPPQLSKFTSYRGISSYHSNKMVVTKSAMNELRAHLPFTQLRFYCRKQQVGRTFHVITTANSSGEAVVQYFSGQTDVLPYSCGSFVRMKNDNSMLAKLCNQWGIQNGRLKVGKWSADQYGANHEGRLDNRAAFVPAGYRWLLGSFRSKWECDDYYTRDGLSTVSGDFWKVFVR